MAKAGGARSTGSPMRGCRRSTVAPRTSSSPSAAPTLPPEPFFSGAALDRADLLRGQPERIDEMAADQAARQLRWTDGFPVLDLEGRLSWGEVEDPALFLGLENGEPRFSSLGIQTPKDARAAFGLLAQIHPADAPTLAAALSLTNWHRRHSFCAGCGQPSAIVRGGWARRCEGCEAEYFPRVDPVVIMLAEHEGRLLLGRQPHYPPGRYSALAGFVEAGETIEAAVARELHEEAGIAVSEVTYVT